MIDFDSRFLSSGFSIIIWAIIIHSIFFVTTAIYYKKQNLSNNDEILLKNILPLGNISFFGMAITTIMYHSNGIFTANMYSIVNRIIINTLCFVSMSGLALGKKNIIQIFQSGALVASLIGATIFFTQDISPQITINNQTLSIFRIDHSIPFLFRSIQKLGSSLNTFIWLIIGASITKESIDIMLKSKDSFIFALQKNIILPLCGILIYILLNRSIGFRIDPNFLPATLMLLVTPVANTLTFFSIKYERSSDLCIACLLTSTLTSLTFFPFFYLLIKYLMSIQIL